MQDVYHISRTNCRKRPIENAIKKKYHENLEKGSK